MLGLEDTISIEHVFEEIMSSGLSQRDKDMLIKRMKKYEGHNDDFDSAEKEVRKKFSTTAKPVEVQKSCYSCGYFDTSLGRGKCKKCHTKSCPVRVLSRGTIDYLLRQYKQR